MSSEMFCPSSGSLREAFGHKSVKEFLSCSSEKSTQCDGQSAGETESLKPNDRSKTIASDTDVSDASRSFLASTVSFDRLDSTFSKSKKKVENINPRSTSADINVTGVEREQLCDVIDEEPLGDAIKNLPDSTLSSGCVNVNAMRVNETCRERQDTDCLTESNIKFQSSITSQTDQEWKTTTCTSIVRQDRISAAEPEMNTNQEAESSLSSFPDFVACDALQVTSLQTTPNSSPIIDANDEGIIAEHLNEKRKLLERAHLNLK